jgi:hypothetical protein
MHLYISDIICSFCRLKRLEKAKAKELQDLELQVMILTFLSLKCKVIAVRKAVV